MNVGGKKTICFDGSKCHLFKNKPNNIHKNIFLKNNVLSSL